jgi:glycine/D-amino acid oxidase-like deaminating enzyme
VKIPCTHGIAAAVVNAAGEWANNVARMVGHELPILAMKVRGGDRRCEATPCTATPLVAV